MSTGFWREPDMDEALESMSLDNGMDAMSYLHGDCGLFALGLADTLGYPILFLADGDGDHSLHSLVHVFCMDGDAYVDVRGRTTDRGAFLAEFADWFTVPYIGAVSPEDLRAHLRKVLPDRQIAENTASIRRFILQKKFY